MLYFIPAWYQEGTWSENEQTWYTRRMHTEFDDTVKQMQLFHRSGAYPYQLILLGYSPNFRHFLHRQSVYHAPYWSCFDAIQQVKRSKATVLSFRNLKWPKGIEFIYSSFAIIAMLHGHKYAQIEFGEDGNPIRVDMFQDNQLTRRNIYDDRGFLSSSMLYQDGEAIHRDYLGEDGTWRIREYLTEDKVEINPRFGEYTIRKGDLVFNRHFAAKKYKNLEEVILEVTASYVEYTDDHDIFCVAMDEPHIRFLKETLHGKKRILSFYEHRFNVEEHQDALDLIHTVDYVIADSQEGMDRIQNAVDKRLDNITDITPYDSRVDFGISAQIPVQKILVPVDDIDPELFERLIEQLGIYLGKNKNARVHLFTRKADYNRKSELLKSTRSALKKAGFNEGWAAEEDTKNEAENELEEKVPILFTVEQCVDELSVSKCMREQRIIVDMREVPELYIQITGISVGIPQIVKKATQFVEDGKNGRELHELTALPDILQFYLDNLTNWNHAMIHSYEVGKKYTTAVLIDKWKEVISKIG